VNHRACILVQQTEKHKNYIIQASMIIYVEIRLVIRNVKTLTQNY